MTDQEMLKQIRAAIQKVLLNGQSASITTPDGSSRSYTLANLKDLEALEKSFQSRTRAPRLKMYQGVCQ